MKGKKKYILLAVVLLLAVAGVALSLMPSNLHEQITIEAGTRELLPTAFLKEQNGDEISFVTDLDTLDFNYVRQYGLQVRHNGKVRDVILNIVDTVPPVATIQNVFMYSHQKLNPNDFVETVSDVTIVSASIKENPDTTVEGSHLVTVVLTDKGGNQVEFEAVLTVYVDEEPPVLVGVKPLGTYIGTRPDYLAGVTATDNRDLDMTVEVDDSLVDYNTLGTYEVTYSVTDDADHVTTAATTVTVSDDDTPPTLLGAQDISLYLGSAVSYRKGLQLKDDKDPNPTLEVISSGVDLSKVGTYPLIYIARDATGNETRVEVTVTVAEKPDAYEEPDVIYQKADELLKKIVSDDMTDEAKVKAIYAHMRANYGYSSHSDKTDWLQGAHVMMKNGSGDCFNYFALTKLLLERLDIPNIDVRKVKNHEGDSSHFWSLVSVDGGETYYHLDTTPRVGSGDDFCLVTDAFLDAYSDAHKKCHNRDKSLYPATPAK